MDIIVRSSLDLLLNNDSFVTLLLGVFTQGILIFEDMLVKYVSTLDLLLQLEVK